MEYIAFNGHKKYTYAVMEDEQRRVKREGKPHAPGALAAFLAGCTPGSGGNDGELVVDRDETEGGGCIPKLVHAAKAKLMLGTVRRWTTLTPGGRGCSLSAKGLGLNTVSTRPRPSMGSKSPRSRTCSRFKEERSCVRS